ncbi:MAG: hypothetical protein J0H25_07365, partial [Rhizobiales bacterium]|nr:hypothetical protein [Hyphomicrobiales bacterium]
MSGSATTTTRCRKSATDDSVHREAFARSNVPLRTAPEILSARALTSVTPADLRQIDDLGHFGGD